MKQQQLKAIGSIINTVSYISPRLAAKIAVQLFSTPQKGALRSMDTAVLESAKKENVSYKNLQIATYHWEGKKDTILLAHGWESNSARWYELINILKNLNYNIIALDAPAHGQSSGKLFNAVLYSECIHVVAKTYKPQIIIGHSVGGMAAVFFQYKYQLPVTKKLVLLGAPSNFVGVFDRYSKMMGYNKKVVEAMNRWVVKKFNHAPAYFSAATFSKAITSKGLIIHDKNDRIIPFSDAIDFKDNYANAQLVTTDGYGHGLKSEEVYNHILDFLSN